MGLTKIGELAAQYGISNRTLRYWDDVGIVKSLRTENGYRYFDDAGIRRIEQIIILRKLRMSIQDIQDIFKSNEPDYVTNVLQRHLEETKHEAEELRTVSFLLERLVETVKAQSNLPETFISLDLSANSTTFGFENTLKNILSERDSCMSEKSSYSKIGDVRIVNLPRMLFACYKAESTTPENDCSKVVNKLIIENSLHLKYGFRHFGFNNPEPQEGNPVYGYEMWVVVPEDFNVPEPFYKKEFSGGLFASIPARLSNIGERWKLLWDWVFSSETYEVDWNPDLDRRWFEECINYQPHNSDEDCDNDLQLDLLAPIKLKVK
ncbi:MAG: MerR family transcriptional regulator [Bacilli bacterium]